LADSDGGHDDVASTRPARSKQTSLPERPVIVLDAGVERRRVVTSSAFDFEMFRDRSRNDVGPDHATARLAYCLDAEIVQPDAEPSKLRDRFGSRIVGRAEHWAVARALSSDMRDGDLVYATGDDSGLAIGLLAAVRRRKIKLAIFYSAPTRLRARTLTKMVSFLGIDLLPIAGSDDKVEFLTALGVGRPGLLASEQTDTSFFRPSHSKRSRSRSLIVSGGLEQRDYATLIEAIERIDVEGTAMDVKICAVSPNFTSDTIVAMPETLPDNVELRRFDFSELRSLYQTAGVTVIPLLDNNYSAGMTTMMEAIACGSPVVITTNPGLATVFAERDLVVGVEPGDAGGLSRAIQRVLDDPVASKERAKRARKFVLENHSSSRCVELLCGSLTVFHSS